MNSRSEVVVCDGMNGSRMTMMLMLMIALLLLAREHPWGVVLERGECDPGVNVFPFFVRN